MTAIAAAALHTATEISGQASSYPDRKHLCIGLHGEGLGSGRAGRGRVPFLRRPGRLERRRLVSPGRCCFLAGVLLNLLASSVCAQGATAPAPSAGTRPDSNAQEQLVRDLLQRLDAEDEVNAELRRRVAVLEALLPPTSAAMPGPSAPSISTNDETTARLEERLDALPRLSGYYDFEYSKDSVPGTFNGFRQHRMFLDVFREYQKFRVMSEVEFESAALVSGGRTGLEEPQRGKVSVEQTWAEYVHSEALTLRAGFILTPNYWNVNAYANVTDSTRMPLIVRNVFPESFVGVMAYGTRYWDTLGIGYSAYISNGQGVNFGEQDDNRAKAVGGVLRFELPTRGLFEMLRIDAIGYADTPAQGPRTRTWGLESQARRGPFELLFEFADRRAEENRRGAYVQPGYRLTDKLTAFYRYDHLRIALGGDTQMNTGGVHFRPITPVSLKFEFFSSTDPATRRIYGLASSFAVAF